MVYAALSTSCIVIIRLDGIHSLHDLSTSNLLKEPRLDAAFSSAVTKRQEVFQRDGHRSLFCSCLLETPD